MEKEEEGSESEESDPFQPLIGSNGLIYSFLPLKTAELLLNKDNSTKSQIKGLKESEKHLRKELKNPNKEFKHYTLDFLSRICILIQDPDETKTALGLKIINTLIQNSHLIGFDNLKSSQELDLLVETLI